MPPILTLPGISRSGNVGGTYPGSLGDPPVPAEPPVAVRIVPCPGVMTIVLYSMILGYLELGILSAIMMSIGMGITISIAAILASSVKQSRYVQYKKRMNYLSYAGIGLLFGFGGLLLL